MYDSITSWMIAGGPRDEHDPEARRRAPHSMDRQPRRFSATLPRWTRPSRSTGMSPVVADCCAAA